MTSHQRVWRFGCVAWAALAMTTTGGSAQSAPQITKVIVNGGANLTTEDQVSVEVLYNHPAAPGVPIPFYRLRVKRPDGPLPQWGDYAAAGGRNAFVAVLIPRGARVVGGTYEIQVQLRDGQGQESAVAIGHVIRASPVPSTLPPPVDYTVTGSEVPTLIGVARLRGYLNTAQGLNSGAACSSWQNDGHWHLRAQKVLVPVPGANEALPNPTCLFGFFKGKKLQFGWRFKSATFESWPKQPATWASYGPAPSGLDAFFSVTVVPTGPMGQGEVRLTTLVFEGPQGSTWQDAFVP